MYIPIIDVFAGPGGLGEGFASFQNKDSQKIFNICLSIEKEEIACRTLELRNFFRKFSEGRVPEEYYEYLRKGKLQERNHYFAGYQEKWQQAQKETYCAELGKTPSHEVDSRIRAALDGAKHWVLIGGPPCQVYSVVGRARMKKNANFEENPHHFLYREYLRIIANHCPTVFIMENVRGILSSTVKGEKIFQRILTELRNPSRVFPRAERTNTTRATYRIYSLTNGKELNEDNYEDCLVKAENYGIPQMRHRVFLMGIREDFYTNPPKLQTQPAPALSSVIKGLPCIRSKISKRDKVKDSTQAWHQLIQSMINEPWLKNLAPYLYQKVLKNIEKTLKFQDCHTGDDNFFFCNLSKNDRLSLSDPRLKGVCNHGARSHISRDLHRYMFVSCYTEHYKRSPNLRDFPEELLPKHRNVKEAIRKGTFDDRFRAQRWDNTSKTITAHLSQDGHAFIHPDAWQCRSLTVREAARIQTFPDNYFFEGSRTAQYRQVGNAVSPLLAYQIAEIVNLIFEQILEHRDSTEKQIKRTEKVTREKDFTRAVPISSF